MSQNDNNQNFINNIKARIGYFEFVALLASLMAINAIAIDIMLPAMHQMGDSLQIAQENDQHYIIFSYLIGFGLAQIALGPLSDRFGRRKPLIFGLFIYSISALLCVFATNFTFLLVLRVIQGIGAAATRVLIISIIRDLYDGREMAKVMSIVIMIFMMVPTIAPALGQGLLFLGSWKTIFLFMAICGIALSFWTYYRLPETLYRSRALDLKTIAKSFKIVCTNRISLCYSLAFSLILGGLFASLNTAEQVYNGIYELGTLFPAAFAAVALSQAVSSYINSKLVIRLGMHRISHSMLILFCIISAIWFVASSFGEISFPLYMILCMSVMYCFGSIGANFNSLSMEPLGEVAGTASALFGFMQTIIGALIGLFIAQHFNHTTTPIACGFLIVGLLALCLVLYAEKGRLFQPTHDNEVLK